MQRMTIDLSDDGNDLLEYAIDWITEKEKLPTKVSRAHAITKALIVLKDKIDNEGVNNG